MKNLCLFPLLLCCMAMKPASPAPSFDFQGKHTTKSKKPAARKTAAKPAVRSATTATAPAKDAVKEAVPEELQSFTEEGMQVSRWQYGDLDADGNRRDALVLLTDIREEEANYRDYTLKPRTVKVLIRGNNGKLVEKLRNDHCLAAKEESNPGAADPFRRFIIQKGDFMLVEQSGFGKLHSEVYTTFHYDGTRNWNLNKRTEIGFRDTKQIGKKITSGKDLGKTDFEHYRNA